MMYLYNARQRLFSKHLSACRTLGVLEKLIGLAPLVWALDQEAFTAVFAPFLYECFFQTLGTHDVKRSAASKAEVFFLFDFTKTCGTTVNERASAAAPGAELCVPG